MFFVLLRLMVRVPVPSYCIVCNVVVCFLLEDICQLTIDWSSTAACRLFACWCWIPSTLSILFFAMIHGTAWNIHLMFFWYHLLCNLLASINFSFKWWWYIWFPEKKLEFTTKPLPGKRIAYFMRLYVMIILSVIKFIGHLKNINLYCTTFQFLVTDN